MIYKTSAYDLYRPQIVYDSMDGGPYVTGDRTETTFTSMDGGPYVIGKRYGFEG